jgi:putative chitinase
VLGGAAVTIAAFLSRLFARAPAPATPMPAPAIPVVAVGEGTDWPRVLRAAGFADPDRWAAALRQSASRYAINRPRRVAAFAATIGHESAGGVRLVESLNYSAKALPAKFGTHRGMNAEVAQRIGRLENDRGAVLRAADQRAIANTIYGGAWGRIHLGNTEPDDGWRFRGRGAIMVTGRDGYQRAANATGLPLLERPELAEEIDAAAEIACWTWAVWKQCNPMADQGAMEDWRRAINGGTFGLDDVRRRYDAVLRVAGNT